MRRLAIKSVASSVKSVFGARTANAVSLSVLAFLLAACDTASDIDPSLSANITIPIGDSQLVQQWETTVLEPGLSHHVISIAPEVSVEPTWSWRSSPLLSEDSVSVARECAAQSGAKFRSTTHYPYPGQPSSEYSILNYGPFKSRVDARADPSRSKLEDCGFRPQSSYDTPENTVGPWHIQVVEIDPAEFNGGLSLGLAQEKVEGLEPVLSIAQRSSALAAINASFFVRTEEHGVVGDPAGLTVIDGQIISEGIQGRYALVVNNQPELGARIQALPGDVSLRWPSGGITLVDGVNRQPGRARNCGNMGDTPTAMARHDETCNDDSEIIIIDDRAGFLPNLEGALSVLITGDGLLQRGAIKSAPRPGEYLLIATGSRIIELERSLESFSEVAIENALSSELAVAFAINGAPLLVQDGKTVDVSDREGWPIEPGISARLADEFHRWINQRYARTAAGITADGRILLVVLDGRDPLKSVGMTIPELRVLMKSLGAVDAINLDGGGSSTLTIGDEVVNAPYDKDGPRHVGDAIMILGANSQMPNQ